LLVHTTHKDGDLASEKNMAPKIYLLFLLFGMIMASSRAHQLRDILRFRPAAWLRKAGAT
jgi:hypothetical protein